jgi:hypothetical protein
MKPTLCRLVLIASLSLVSPSSAIEAQDGGNAAGCPAMDPSGARPVARALTESRLAWFRRAHDLTRVNAKRLRPLTGRLDGAICEQLNAYYAGSMYSTSPWRRSYYMVDGFYFASFVDTTDPIVRRVQISHFAMFDDSLKLRAILSPK